MTEPDVALTDYGVTLECSLFAWLLFRGRPPASGLRRLFAIFFGSTGLAALAGGTVHGFFLDEGSVAGALLWRIALVALGLSTFAAWSIGGRMLLRERPAHVLQLLAGVECVAYGIVVLALDQRYSLAIANYAPAVVWLGVALLVTQRTAGVIGVVLTVLAAIVQRRHIALSPGYFNHNALYHGIQMTALALIFLAGRQVIAARAAVER